jgi:hypothetical protein
MDYKTLSTPAAAERFVETQQALGNDVRWDNYDMVFFRADPRGRSKPEGAFRNSQWGFENRFPVDDDGAWRVGWQNVARRAKRTSGN